MMKTGLCDCGNKATYWRCGSFICDRCRRIDAKMLEVHYPKRKKAGTSRNPAVIHASPIAQRWAEFRSKNTITTTHL